MAGLTSEQRKQLFHLDQTIEGLFGQSLSPEELAEFISGMTGNDLPLTSPPPSPVRPLGPLQPGEPPMGGQLPPQPAPPGTRRLV